MRPFWPLLFLASSTALLTAAERATFHYDLLVESAEGLPLRGIPFRLDVSYQILAKDGTTAVASGREMEHGVTGADGRLRLTATVARSPKEVHQSRMSLQREGFGFVNITAEGTTTGSPRGVARFRLERRAGEPENRCLDDVPRQFRRLPTEMDAPGAGYLTVFTYRLLPWPRYSAHLDNRFGYREHVQGIQRIGRYLVLSGGIRNGAPRRSQLLIIEMGSRRENGPWAHTPPGEVERRPHPDADDRMVSFLDIDREYWHGGGIQAMDHVIVVPLMNDERDSQLRFYDFRDPLHPVDLNLTIERPRSRATAAGLVRLPDGHYLAAVYTDEALDFHFSRGEALEDGFEASPLTVRKTDIPGFEEGACGSSGCGGYQHLNFIADCDGSVYLLATRNSQAASPTFAGEELASLYRLQWQNGDPDHSAPRIELVLHQRFSCRDRRCNFGAAAAAYVDDRDHLILYGASHALRDWNRRYLFAEFSY